MRYINKYSFASMMVCYVDGRHNRIETLLPYYLESQQM